MLEELQSRNVCIYVSGVNSEEDLDKALSYDIDGVITTDVKLITELLSTRENIDNAVETQTDNILNE